MPYKRKDSPFYQIEITLPGYGVTSQITSGVTDKSIARRMESMLRDIAQKALVDPSYYRLLDAVCRDKTLPLPEVLRAQSTGNLQSLSRTLTTPLVCDAIEVLKRASSYDRPTWVGLAKLDELTGNDRLSELTAKRITELCFAVEREGVQRNTVCRQFKRAVSKLLTHHMGRSERNRIFADVEYAAEDDTRKIRLSPQEIAHLIDTCEQMGYHEAGVLVRVAIQTSADRSVLLSGKTSNTNRPRVLRGLLNRDIQVWMDNETGEYEGTLTLMDEKTVGRDRTVPITDYLCRELVAMTKDKGPDDPVFNMKYMDLDYIWQAVRKEAGFWSEESGYAFRFKDLRAVASQYGAEAGIPQQVLSSTYGHKSERMTRRYQTYNAAMTNKQAKALEDRIFGKTG